MILLDVDDTLINHTQAQYAAALAFGQQFQRSIPNYDTSNPATFANTWQAEAERNIQRFLAGEISFQAQRQQRIRGIFANQAMGDRQADELFQQYLHHYENAWELFPDVVPFLAQHCHGTFGILSDGSQAQQERKLEKTGIRQFFQFVITAEATGCSKPDPAFFAQACSLAGTAPSETFYIGDKLQKDALGAVQAGLNGVWLNRHNQAPGHAVYTIRQLSEFSPEQAVQKAKAYS